MALQCISPTFQPPVPAFHRGLGGRGAANVDRSGPTTKLTEPRQRDAQITMTNDGKV